MVIYPTNKLIKADTSLHFGGGIFVNPGDLDGVVIPEILEPQAKHYIDRGLITTEKQDTRVKPGKKLSKVGLQQLKEIAIAEVPGFCYRPGQSAEELRALIHKARQT